MMEIRVLGNEAELLLEQVLGYLNFSSGAEDHQFLANLNQLFAIIEKPDSEQPTWRTLLALLQEKLPSLQGQAAFRDTQQAAAVTGDLLEKALPAYLEFHRDLLFHHTETSIFNSLFVGRVCEAVLQQGAPWDETNRIVDGAIADLNDYIGHRPVATLEGKKIEPYAREWLRPVPLYIRDVGVASGTCLLVIEKALKLLRETDEDLLRNAHFDPQLLDELAVDPRAFDFDHPANRRPSYLFGQWDPHHIDNHGRYRRFVAQQVTLDALMSRIAEPGNLLLDEVIFEAAAVLAGTILMAAGISGSGPDSHDSTVTLTSLLPKIASYRDAFYERLFSQVDGSHAERLRAEASELKQPFGGARQHLNAQLARRRASQLEHVELAKIFARMGYPEAAAQQADVVPVASARMLCRIDCRLSSGLRAIQNGNLEKAASLLPQIRDLLDRGIQCGAIVDPWNILGFDAQYSYFSALENSVRDHRIDDLLELVEQISAYYSRLWSEAAAQDQQELCQQIDQRFQALTEWWHRYAAHEVTSVETPDPQDVYDAARHVARALNLWHKGGASAGDIGFWSPHADMFDSPRAYALVIDALLERGDFVASMALLVHWLGQIDRIGLEEGDSSFHRLALRWQVELRHGVDENNPPVTRSISTKDVWPLTNKFLDYLEANAEEYWEVPQFELGVEKRRDNTDDLFASEMDSDDDKEELFGAAYENVVYRDSTNDGIDSEIFDTSNTSDDELEAEAKRLGQRLNFLGTLARLWKLAAVLPCSLAGKNSLDESSSSSQNRVETMSHWSSRATINRRRLMDMLSQVQSHRIPTPNGDHDSMLQYDRRRVIKESLLEQIITTCVETNDADRLLIATVTAQKDTADVETKPDEDACQSNAVLAAVLRRDVDEVRRLWGGLMESLAEAPLLYVPLSKGGDPQKIVDARVRQQAIADLLNWLPRLGLLTETCRLLETAREMERDNPVGSGAVTEFDELFKIGYKALVESLVASAELWENTEEAVASQQTELVKCLEQLTESLLLSWLEHSRTLRLSVMEKVLDKTSWNNLISFIERYGDELFTQRFLAFSNIRAILHQGVDAWLRQLKEDPRGQVELRLLDDLDTAIEREEAIEQLTVVLDAVFENYAEYRDYNSTTTQSDRGESLFQLLDFLRLRAKYDRVAWQLRPVIWAHEILVRRGQTEAAKLWRRSLAERFGEEADKYIDKLKALQKKYAMRMSTVANRLSERFVHPMMIDRIRALVEPAVQEARQAESRPTFELLKQQIELLMRQPSGAGLDLPPWLQALDEEVDAVCRPSDCGFEVATADEVISPSLLSREETQRQLDLWTKKK